MLTIWFENGTTALFQQVEEFRVIENNIIKCTYFGVSHKVRRELKINLNKIAAYAYNDC